MQTSCKTLFGTDDRAALAPYMQYAQQWYKAHAGGLLIGAEAGLLLRAIETASKLSAFFVEIGTHRGNTAQMVGSFLADKGLPGVLISIDPGCQVPLTLHDDAMGRGRNLFIRRASLDVSRAWTARIGLVFVDGCHCTQCVHADISAWAPFIVPGGFFVFHDVTSDGRRQARTLHDDDRPSGVGAALKEDAIIASEFQVAGSAARQHMVAYQKKGGHEGHERNPG